MIEPFTVGERVWFAEEVRPYTVQAVSIDGRWVAATKPFAAQRTVLYTVLDTERQVRGRDNCYGLGYETRKACALAVAAFRRWDDWQRGQITTDQLNDAWPDNQTAEHSHRYPPIPINIRRREAPR